jgi:FkbM family methyltransferase
MIGIARFIWSHPICRKGRLRAFARVLHWQMRSRLQHEVVVSWIAGQRLVARRGMTGATGNIYAGLHEFPDMALMLHFLRPDDLFFDIGANVGCYTVLASGVCRARTWAFEPDPTTAADLDRNVAINALWKRVTVHQIALGATEADIPFTIGRDTENKVANPADPNVRIVRQVALDTLAGANVPAMIKMDVEGYEPEVIKGAASLLCDSRLKVIESETVTAQWSRRLTRSGSSQCNMTLSRGSSHGPAAGEQLPTSSLFVTMSSFARD